MLIQAEDKVNILKKIILVLKKEESVVEKSMLAAKDETTHEDTKQEGKYDTRAIEAGYLAGAQEQRLKILSANIKHLEVVAATWETDPKACINEKLGAGTIVEVTEIRKHEGQEQKKYYFILPSSAGIEIEHNNDTYVSISTDSILGAKFLGKEAGEEIELSTPKGEKIIIIEQFW
jgi:transcription elongation GreA/GreB family factor